MYITKLKLKDRVDTEFIYKYKPYSNGGVEEVGEH